MLGERVAGENVTVIDDGTLVFDHDDKNHDGSIRTGGFGTSPFDGEGLPTRRTVLIEDGVLKSYVNNTYTARKLGMASTGNASRSLASNPGIGEATSSSSPARSHRNKSSPASPRAFTSRRPWASASTWSPATTPRAPPASG